MPARFEPRRRIGQWTLVYDRTPPGQVVIRERWYVAALGGTHVLGPYYKGTASTVLEALAKVEEKTTV